MLGQTVSPTAQSVPDTAPNDASLRYAWSESGPLSALYWRQGFNDLPIPRADMCVLPRRSARDPDPGPPPRLSLATSYLGAASLDAGPADSTIQPGPVEPETLFVYIVSPVLVPLPETQLWLTACDATKRLSRLDDEAAHLPYATVAEWRSPTTTPRLTLTRMDSLGENPFAAYASPRLTWGPAAPNANCAESVARGSTTGSGPTRACCRLTARGRPAGST